MSHGEPIWSRGTAPRAHAALLAMVLVLASSAYAQVGQEDPEQKDSKKEDSKQGDLSKRMQKGTTWQLHPGCAKAQRLALGDPTKATPKERLEALRELEMCWAREKAAAAAQTSDRLAARDLYLVNEEIDRLEEKKKEITAQDDFRGIRFGVGVGVSFSEDDVISDADVGAGNIVSSTKNERTQPRVILESHYYGWCTSPKCKAGEFGIGPYFGIVAREDDLISAFGTGVMFGWKDSKGSDPQGISIGIGVVLDSNVKSLAGGFEDGKPLPAGETSIRFEEKSRWSALLFFTRTF